MHRGCGGPDTVALLSRQRVIEKEKIEDPARYPEGNLMTLDNMKPERGMWSARNTHVHTLIRTHTYISLGGPDGKCVGRLYISSFKWTDLYFHFPERGIRPGNYVTAGQPGHW